MTDDRNSKPAVPQAADFEKLGLFYLGRETGDDGDADGPAMLYDARDLTTHAMCVGMTGSGKTGLCITLLEEAALDGVPALIIDPKGDLGNLLLTFPELDAASFEPWIDPDAAQRAERTVAEQAAAQAEMWRNGLASWGQDGERIARLRSAVEMTLFTPGSRAGTPVSILSSFDAPPVEMRDLDPDAFEDLVASTVAGLLALLGLEADPVRSRETILLAQIFGDAWRRGENLALADLVHRVQRPEVEQIGVLPLESFYPEKDRFRLAMSLNNLLASPSFQSWLEGDPLDVERLLWTADGRPRLAIFSIAHLSDPERMFFVTLLLERTLGWMRAQPGTSSLRALVYMDEVFGYLPPVAAPPSKKPLLTMLKQARAYGLGVVLATQNPVDLDYKALSNLGTWFLGRLQTERDQERLLEGLTAADGSVEPREVAQQLSSIPKRTFLLHSVHERGGPRAFRVRWAMSYLRGPLTRRQIRSLSEENKTTVTTARDERPAADSSTPAPPRAQTPSTAQSPAASSRPVLPGDLEERFWATDADVETVYRSWIFGEARVRFVDKKRGGEVVHHLTMAAPTASSVDWSEAESLDPDGLRDQPRPGSRFEAPSGDLGDRRAPGRWRKGLSDHLYRSRRLRLAARPDLDLVARPDEDEQAFRRRVEIAAREERDRELDELRRRWETKLDRERDQVRRAEQRVDKEREQARTQQLGVMGDLGTTLVGSLFGGRSRRSLGTAARRLGRTFRERGDVERAEETLDAERQDVERLEAESRAELEEVRRRFDKLASDAFETVELRPRRIDVEVLRVGVLWAPVGDFFDDDGTP
ncbi:MAG: DUF87 domain-containing protein [Acidobacteriota bacterium]